MITQQEKIAELMGLTSGNKKHDPSAHMDVTVLYATTIVPFDEETLQAAVARASANMILVEPYYEGGLVQDVARALRSRAARIDY